MPDLTMQTAVRGALPSKTADGSITGPRVGTYQELIVQPLALPRHAYSNEGTYFTAHNATNDAATTLAGHAAPVLANVTPITKAFIHLMNPSSTGIRAYLDYIQIEVITAGAAGTADSWAAEADTGATRITSGNTALTTVNGNMQSTAQPVLQCNGGAIVTATSTAAMRQLGFGQFRPTIQIAGDKYTFIFGGESMELTDTINTIAHHYVPLPPVVLGLNDQFLLALYSPSQSGAGVYKVRMGWVER